MFQLILASESPRRKQLLENAGFSFTTYPSNVSENIDKNLTVNEQILDIARRKARFVFDQKINTQFQPFLVLAADTMVILNQRPLGKPRDEREAKEFLRALSGRAHEVKTAVILLSSESSEEKSHVETSLVKFKPLSEKEISDYIKTGEPMDKAGAYAIQGLGRAFVESFQGSFDNIVGLPVEVVSRMIENVRG